ncbi:hypothetical protein VE01_09463 [Pseudogymnoascus verrucosus]|uniref:Uncharacterized protein n=1 Tax=Pseudogymnoascus verrucosus TaxID=342668 RepID=A0A1B8G9M7_9PEZI|nr:uncharacterized protein VE01_09463 [Pseudogymnoascus verrucosus]OBT92535.1 hypothetical protein VE01_09463 [Pseudogymnoascus verrucosus]
MDVVGETQTRTTMQELMLDDDRRAICDSWGYVSNVVLDIEVEAKFVRNGNPSQQPFNNISFELH